MQDLCMAHFCLVWDHNLSCGLNVCSLNFMQYTEPNVQHSTYRLSTIFLESIRKISSNDPALLFSSLSSPLLKKPCPSFPPFVWSKKFLLKGYWSISSVFFKLQYKTCPSNESPSTLKSNHTIFMMLMENNIDMKLLKLSWM